MPVLVESALIRAIGDERFRTGSNYLPLRFIEAISVGSTEERIPFEANRLIDAILVFREQATKIDDIQLSARLVKALSMNASEKHWLRYMAVVKMNDASVIFDRLKSYRTIPPAVEQLILRSYHDHPDSALIRNYRAYGCA